MEYIKKFKRSKEFIVNTLYDVIELQKGRLILSDYPRGIVYYGISMYGYEWELMYTVAEITGRTARGVRSGPGPPGGECSVTLRIIGERRENEKEMKRAFALLESMLDL